MTSVGHIVCIAIGLKMLTSSAGVLSDAKRSVTISKGMNELALPALNGPSKIAVIIG